MASAIVNVARRVGRAAGRLVGIGGNPGPQDILEGIFPSSWGTPPLVNTKSLLETYDTAAWVRACAGRIGDAITMHDWQLYAVGAPPAKAVGRIFAETERYSFDVNQLASAMGAAVEAAVTDRIRIARGRLEGWATKDAIVQRQQGPARWKRLEALRKAGRLQEVAEHPFYDAVENPNPFMGRAGLFKITEVSLDLVGDAFWLKQRNGASAPVGFWPIPAHWIVQTPTPERPVYRTSWRGWQKVIPESEVLWFHEPAPVHPYERGSGVGWALGDEIEIDEYVAKMTKQMFFNDADPKWIFAGGSMSDTEVKRLERDFLQKNQGFWRKFKPYFMVGGGDEVDINKRIHEFQRPTMEQLVYPGLRKAQRDIVMQTYGVPPEVFGISEHGTLAQTNYEGAEYLFAKWVVLPRGERMRSILQSKLMPEYDDRLVLDFPNPVPEDKRFELEVMAKASWAWSADEWRKKAGTAPMPDDKGRVYLVPLNSHITTDLGDASQRPVGAAAGGTPPAAESETGGPMPAGEEKP